MFTLWIKTGDLTDSLALYAEIEEFKVNLTDLIDYSLIYGDCTIEDALTVISLTEKYSHILSISLQKEQVQYLLIFLYCICLSIIPHIYTYLETLNGADRQLYP